MPAKRYRIKSTGDVIETDEANVEAVAICLDAECTQSRTLRELLEAKEAEELK